MSDPVRFLSTFAHALAGMALYTDGHPARERAIDAAFRELQDLQADTARPLFTFLGDEIVYGNLPLRELQSWEWSGRLADAGIQRLEFEDRVTREDFEGFLHEVLARITLSVIDTSTARQLRRSSIRFGAVGVRGDGEAAEEALPTATLSFSLGEEAEAIRWLHEEVRQRESLPLVEAEAVVRSLSVAMHSGQQILMPLLHLKEFDQYTTTHSMNVAVLAMALAEFLEMGASDVRAFGIAGLLHDLGKVRIPLELLTKPGKLTPDERDEMARHPAEGARIILESEEDLDLAAVVAYEHHIMLNGGGYPRVRFQRPCHQASNLVHVCDVYDALRTRRPYRDAWPPEQVLRYLEGRAGMEFDPALVEPFVAMMRKWDQQVAVLDDEARRFPGVATFRPVQGKIPVMRMSQTSAMLVALAALASGALSAQAAASGRRARLEGKWQARGPDDAIHDIMVRSDSSAQFGDQVARWRVVGDSLWLTLGDGVWMVYGMKMDAEKLTLSGGDLEKPVTLRRVGVATARPDTLSVPDAPPPSARAW